MCVCVCVCVYIHICMCTVHVSVLVCVRLTCFHSCVLVYVSVYLCMYVYVHVNICMYVCTLQLSVSTCYSIQHSTLIHGVHLHTGVVCLENGHHARKTSNDRLGSYSSEWTGKFTSHFPNMEVQNTSVNTPESYKLVIS